jgi:hypothetical protein
VELSYSDGIHFSAIGDTLTLEVRVSDANGTVLPASALWFLSRDTAVVTVDARGVLKSVGDGLTRVVVSDGIAGWDSVTVSVLQTRDSLLAAFAEPGPIISVPEGAPLPLSCRPFDVDGHPLALDEVVTSTTSLIVGSTCETLEAKRSGFDTLVVTAGPYRSTIPLAVTVAPVVTSDPAAPFPVDSIPRGSTPWAPTLIRNPRGGFDLYFAGYRPAPHPLSGVLGNLHRLTSADGGAFRYDGVVLRRNPSICTLQGTGIENVAIAPRADSVGWRMFFAAGSSCYGWQVFSAVSPDQVHWKKEPGVRISNGGVVPPLAPGTAPWPAGEGMSIDQRPDGSWRMIVGAYEHLSPAENRFQIVQWSSPDQQAWTYQFPVLTTRDVGPLADRSIYSPSIQRLAPGLYRMFFAGDNLKSPGGQSRIYTAVSTDLVSWQLEGVLLENAQIDFSYSSYADGLLAYIKTASGGARSLGLAHVSSH